ncbi:Hypothetical predicted protein [Octopus vulgaris]|uniref:Uncharacterized protein n=1 Tax=Octopus vulgaris TaxID=6645 RepID=A0AA36B6I1_OCTVU|nr:Hypothetical predicted protein [Octopus vulgaris]
MEKTSKNELKLRSSSVENFKKEIAKIQVKEKIVGDLLETSLRKIMKNDREVIVKDILKGLQIVISVDVSAFVVVIVLVDVGGSECYGGGASCSSMIKIKDIQNITWCTRIRAYTLLAKCPNSRVVEPYGSTDSTAAWMLRQR